jgi:hypothetical protein
MNALVDSHRRRLYVKWFKRFRRHWRSLFRRKPMNRNVFVDIDETHGHEEKLRGESMAMVTADPELSRRLETVQKAMALILNYTIDHTSRSEDETTMQLLGIRLFNAAPGIKLALSGYYQTAFHQARDIMETGYLLDYFRTSQNNVRCGSSRTGRRAESFLPQ